MLELIISYYNFAASYVWPLTIILVVISVICTAILIITCLFHNLYEQIENKKIDKIRSYFLVHILHQFQDPKELFKKDKIELKLIAKVIPEILRNLKGKAYDDAIILARKIELDKWLAHNMNSHNKNDLINAIILASYIIDDDIKNNLLKRLLIEKDPFIKNAIIDVISNTKDESLLPIIIKEFNQNEEISYLLIYNIFKKFGHVITPKLSSIVRKKHTKVKVKIAALMALIKYGDIEDVKLAANELYDSKNKSVRKLALDAFAKIGSDIDLEVLQLGLTDKDWEVRISAIKCAANVRPFPFKIVTNLLNDKNWIVAMQAANILMGAGRAGNEILKIISQNNAKSGQRVAIILEENFHERNNQRINYGNN